MLIENLVRLGRPFLEQKPSARETLLQITDVLSPWAVGFFCNVVIVEVDEGHPGTPPAAWGVQDWTARRVQGRSQVVEVKRDIAVAAPFTLPRGNITQAQGRYPVPVYIIYQKHMEAFRDPEKVNCFLQGRYKQTLVRPAAPLLVVAQAVASAVAGASLSRAGKNRKVMGLLLVLPVSDQGPYRYVASSDVDPETMVDLGPSQLRPGQRVVADLPSLVSLVWAAKVEEGATHGQMEGPCTLCHREGQLVSIYSMAWPWFASSWRAPLPKTLAKKQLLVTMNEAGPVSQVRGLR